MIGPKVPTRRSKNYLRWVATLPCAHCGRHGPSQAAHSDEGKGMGLKAGDDTAYPLCADGPSRSGCHSLIGTSGHLSREDRRALEKTHSSYTQALAKYAGTWPKGWTD